MTESKKSIRVLLVEDEDFTRILVKELLESSGLNTAAVHSVTDALAQMETFDPHVVISDLDLGVGPDGADLLAHVAQVRPWTGMIVMTAHASPHLAISDANRIPLGTVYIVKSNISSKEKLLLAVEESIQKNELAVDVEFSMDGKVTITSNQAEILKMLSDGLSNAAIAEARGITLRAAEALIQRTFAALGVNNDPNVNSRVAAVKLWHQGKVAVK
ncbi:MAG: response regulator [Actinomycetes bacterium]